jgi:drug/metabolite transporter (DMT)-like permease
MLLPLRGVAAAPLHLPQQNALKGGLYMAIAMAAFVSNDTLLKLLSHELPVGTLIFVRGVFASIMLFAATVFSGALPKLPLMFSGHVLLRSLTDVVSTILFISALVHMPIGNLTSVTQAAPLVVTALAAIFLKERVGWRRTAAIIAGFIGVMLIMKPNTSGFDRYSIMALVLVAGIAVRDILTRRISASVPALVVALANSVFVVAGAYGLALFEGGLVMPRGYQVIYLAAAGAFLSLGYLFMVQTLRYANISATASIRFSVVLWALLSGIVVFGELPDGYAVVGILLIVASGIYTLHREAKLKKQRTSQAAA